MGLHLHTKELYTSEAREKASLMMSQTKATQKYVREVLRPKISSIIPPEDFIIEAMSTSYISRNILSALSSDIKGFDYRRVAKNARNPEYEVNEHEEKIFNRFAEDKNLDHMEKIRELSGEMHLTVARPIYFTKDCMWCHGDPKDAPQVMINRYGDERGFYRYEGELAGIESVTVSLHKPSGALGRTTTVFTLWFASGILVLFFFIQLFFNRLVVFNLKRVGQILQRTFSLTKTEEEMLLPLEKEEEIEGMISSIEHIASHLGEAREKLNAYAKNLENMVEERTEEISGLLKDRSADVNLFIQLLEGLNEHSERNMLLETSLSLISKHFGACSAFYSCVLDDSNMYFWPPVDGKVQDVDKDHIPKAFTNFTPENLHLNALEKPLINKDCWIFPVKASGQTRGFMGLYWGENIEQPSPLDKSLAFTFGSQLGIALDNLDAINALLHQNTLLDSLVEGVPDPLILADGNNYPLLTNSSARDLAQRLFKITCSLKSSKTSKEQDKKDSLKDKLQALIDFFVPELALPNDKNSEDLFRSREYNLSDGRTFVVRVYPLQGTALQPARNVIHIREITNEKAMLDHLRHNEKLAAVGQLAASIAHEINNPLGVIRCYAELLENSLKDGQEKDDVKIILKHVDGARNVLSDLLSFARPKAEKYEECNIEESINSLLELLKAKISKSKILYRVDLDKEIPDICTDRGILDQVLVNLFLNAVDAITKKGTKLYTDKEEQKKASRKDELISIRAWAEKDQKQVCISVTDTGGGIKESELSKIFDPFYTTKSIGEGTGLGLTIAFGMIREMGGTLKVKNHYQDGAKTGAVFTICLPEKGQKNCKCLYNEED